MKEFRGSIESKISPKEKNFATIWLRIQGKIASRQTNLYTPNDRAVSTSLKKETFWMCVYYVSSPLP